MNAKLDCMITVGVGKPVSFSLLLLQQLPSDVLGDVALLLNRFFQNLKDFK